MDVGKERFLHSCRQTLLADGLTNAKPSLTHCEQTAQDKDGQTAKQCAERRVAYFRALGWPHWARQEESRIRDAFPPSYPLF